jgi:hypothetical protein
VNRDIRNIPLRRSDHAPGQGMSAMEMVAAVANEPPSNQPACASPVLAQWMLAWADALDDDGRQQLRAYVPALAASRSPLIVETARQWRIIDWLIRTATPIWLQGAGLYDHGDAVLALAPIATPGDLALARSATERTAEAAHTAEIAASTAASEAQPDASGVWHLPTGQDAMQRDCGPPDLWAVAVDATLSAIEATVTMADAAHQAAGYAAMPPADHPPAWTMATATIVHASAAIAWRGIRTLVASQGWSADLPPDRAWHATGAAAHSSLQPTERATQEASHRLVTELLQMR